MGTFPSAVISFTDPTSTDKLNSPSHSSQHSTANGEIEAVETELGVDPAGSHATVVARLNDMTTYTDVVYHSIATSSTVVTTRFWRAPYACDLSAHVQTMVSSGTVQVVSVAHTSGGDNALSLAFGTTGTVGVAQALTASAVPSATAGEVMRFVVVGCTVTAQLYGITLVLAKTDTT